MNNKVRKRKKNSRKVILLKYKETRNTRIKDSLKITIQCNTQPVKEVNRTVTQENYPIFRAQMKDRIVPRCSRHKCKRKTNDNSKNHDAKIRKIRSPSLITVSEEECDGLQYDDVSSGSWTDDEIDVLMESTRKRMKDSDEQWKLMPRERESSKKLHKQIKTPRASRNPSLNSLDTLVVAKEEDVLTKQKLKTVPSETKHDRVKRGRYAPRQSLKRKSSLSINEDEPSSDVVNTDANSQITSPKKKIKLETVEMNNSGPKRKSDSYESKLYKEVFQEKEKQLQTTHQQDNAVLQAVTKEEPPETNNNITNQPNYVAIECQNSFINFKTYNEIDAVIRKLEKNDMDNSSGHTELNFSLIDIKQELYSDI